MEIGEGIVSRCIRVGRVNHRPVTVEQGHRDTGHAGLTRILDAILIGVVPDMPAETRRLDSRDQGRTSCQILLGLGQRDDVSPAIWAEGDELVPRRQLEFHDIIARFQGGEGVVTGCVCGCQEIIASCGNNNQTHHNIWNGSLTLILNAVLIRVIPDMTAKTRKG